MKCIWLKGYANENTDWDKKYGLKFKEAFAKDVPEMIKQICRGDEIIIKTKYAAKVYKIAMEKIEWALEKQRPFEGYKQEYLEKQ